MRLAAIDIGSNAARLLISEVTRYKDGTIDYTKISLVRIPLRLGFEVFEFGKLSVLKEKKLIDSIQAYKHLMNVFEVKDFRAIATSAMRDATNGTSIVQKIKKQTGVDIEIISGNGEAELLFETQLRDHIKDKNFYLYADVGGGSTEITLFKKNKIIANQSFNIGTIRLLKNAVLETEYEKMKTFIRTNCAQKEGIIFVGSGGNINKVFSLSKQKVGKPLNISVLKNYYKELKGLNIEERMHTFNLREDRADVIVPALSIYLLIMKWARFQSIEVPQVGLVDGIIKKLYHKQNKE